MQRDSWALRQHLSVLNPLDALRNKRFLSANAISQTLYYFRMELSLILQNLLPPDTRKTMTATELWKILQHKKAAALHETIGMYTTPGYILAEIKKDPRALALYSTEQHLIKQFHNAHGTMYLYQTQRELMHHQFSVMDANPLLKSLIEK